VRSIKPRGCSRAGDSIFQRNACRGSISPRHKTRWSLHRGDAERAPSATGAEVMEIVDGKIKEIRDYHRLIPAKLA
jgi:hypothetical protein